MAAPETDIENPSGPNECRYCKDSIQDNTHHLIRPCKCASFVHVECLEEFINKHKQLSKTKCEICQEDFPCETVKGRLKVSDDCIECITFPIWINYLLVVVQNLVAFLPWYWPDYLKEFDYALGGYGIGLYISLAAGNLLSFCMVAGAIEDYDKMTCKLFAIAQGTVLAIIMVLKCAGMIYLKIKYGEWIYSILSLGIGLMAVTLIICTVLAIVLIVVAFGMLLVGCFRCWRGIFVRDQEIRITRAVADFS